VQPIQNLKNGGIADTNVKNGKKTAKTAKTAAAVFLEPCINITNLMVKYKISNI